MTRQNFISNDKERDYTMDLKSKNNGFGPLSRPRSETVLYVVAVSSLTAIVLFTKTFILSYRNTNLLHFLSIFCAMASSLILGEIARKLTLFVEEVRHVNERYDGSRLRAFQKCMDFGKRTGVS